ncbi:MAG: cupin domain-containing protein [Calditrichaeota bacterium]|nr:MAG: cupin domain-containing protein [Calditrichota bacterium]
MIKRHIDSPERIPVTAGQKTEMQMLISPGEAPHFAMRRFTIHPGGFMPMHTNTVEHEQLVLDGEAEVIIDGQKHHMRKDDVVFIPAGVPHSYRTIGDRPFVFLCMVPNQQDTITLLEAQDKNE